MLGFFSKMFGGSKSEKDVKKIEHLVTKINQHFSAFQSLSNDELRNKTQEFRNRIKDHLTQIDQEIVSKNEEAEALDFNDLLGKDAIYQQVDKLKKDRDKKIEEALNDILPEAFAVVKETARRFKENETVTATVTPHDRDLSVKRDYITIVGDQVHFKNTWLAAGGQVTWNMVHYDVQLIGGIVLHQGKISEMATGEGKTLVSTLPAYLNALPGEGVHIVTVNDYLARRDQEWNGPIFEWLGLNVDCIDKHQPNSEERRKAYLADITYGTNNEFGFDYLRDNMVHNADEMVQRKHHYAMVDEVDSVLIDDARTPLIISGPVPKGEDQQFHIHKPRIQQLVQEQERIVRNCLNEAKKRFAEGDDDPKGGGLYLYRAFRGLPKYGPVIKFLSEPGVKVKMQKAENYYLQDQERNMKIVDEELLFKIDEKNNSVDLSDRGLNMITRSGEDPEFFVLPDIGVKLAEIEKSEISNEEKLQAKESILNDYAQKADRIHTVQQLLKAYTLFTKDVEYIIDNGAIKIVDEQTGRVLDGRRYSDGLHQAIEAKENVKIEAATQTYATVTLQNYFRMYHKLAGMTGTAETEAAELWSIYKLDVVSIPTNLKMVRKDKQDLVYKTKREKYKAVIDEIEALRNAGRPCLVGTTSVEISELLSRMLQQKKIPHNVLNAKQHAKEAQIVAEAGLPGAVTIATNMAGRGTDIKLGAGVKEAGGLAIIGTERHESRRVDRQLRGRAGRQGDPGSSQFYVSLEDDLMRMFGSERIASMMDKLGYKEGDVIQHSMISNSIQRAQKKVEENNFGIRKRLLEYDDVMNHQRNAVYKRRNHALFGERLALDIDTSYFNMAEGIVNSYKEQDDYEGFKMACIVNFGVDSNINSEVFQKTDSNSLTDKLYEEISAKYSVHKEEVKKQAIPVFKNIRLTQGSHIENVVVPFTDGKKSMNVLANLDKTIKTEGGELASALEKTITLVVIDDAWKNHLRAMDDLKQSVQTAYLEQKDPLVIYKVEAYKLFEGMNGEVNRDIVSFLSHATLPLQDENANLKEGRQQKTDMSKMQANKEEVDAAGEDYAANEKDKPVPITVGPKIGRNDPCPCGSGKKYKNCHGVEA
ncbi:MAG TPA: preprotein translocase subunit SecA [Chitinophagaceae bacterium]|nr:preprotein translocase subunit SecA [Chitinophagaceae bacterium]HNF45172.1 preprotein translocase subunit SecA [Chitinophagaceae bacterium]HNJ24811.1 preprotein translocase subunit SecA [Chitinophagaceae bacterium]HNJ55210.1 preprotein translocase subunit SecA [Chitinophagaceae bacterium]HNK59958.1 preprotein translocase subunit SecA [Chitinophagaceae bacterium]